MQLNIFLISIFSKNFDKKEIMVMWQELLFKTITIKLDFQLF